MKIEDVPARVHFVGAGGIGMSGLAEYLLRTGRCVSGSDRTANDRTQALCIQGAKIYIGHDALNVGQAELVVRTSAVPTDNAEVAEAVKRGIPVILREELLGVIFNSFDTRIAVCGAHGKTTVTAMIHELLTYCNVDHAAFIGGVYRGENMYFGRNVAVAEACEYNRSFLNLSPTLTVCTNVEYDHPDCYANERDVLRAFSEFFCRTSNFGAVILPKKLAALLSGQKSVFYDEEIPCVIRSADGKTALDLNIDGARKRLELSVLGRHNAVNALIALTVGEQLGLNINRCVEALSAFKGVDRRWTEREGSCRIVCDYAHHPTEIACAVETAKSVCKGKVLCVFQPHTYTRTQAFFDEFVSCFARADLVAYLPIYSAREAPVEGVTSQALAKRAVSTGIDACYSENFEQARRWILSNAKKDDLVLVLGAGDVANLADML
ncbi:MAG: UDP-N-acetylmuramate--L-alanine ligase [Corallococcus sp.]|nr:UDP-N-acetylmuramate--L-alanine ligase [Corallococcus sp.]